MSRVLHSCPTLSRSSGGIFEVVRQLTEAQVRHGQRQILAIGMGDASCGEDRNAWSHCETAAYRHRGPKKIGWSPEIDSLYRRIQPSIVHLHGLWQYHGVINRSYCLRKQIPYIVSPHGMLDPWALKNSRIKKKIWWALSERSHLLRANCLHALCAEEALAIRRLGLPTPVVVIPNGVNEAIRSSMGPPWRDQLGTDRKIMLFLGRLHPKKGLDNLLSGWQQMLRDNRAVGQEWALAIAGWGDEGYKRKLTERISEIAPVNSVAVIGSVFGEQKAAALSNAQGFILPSFSEGLPMAVLEAWAYRIPVLMTKFCNLPIGFDRKAALQISTDAPSISKSLSEFFQLSESARTEIGDRGLLLSRNEFSWMQIAAQFEKVYQWLTGGKAPEEVLFP